MAKKTPTLATANRTMFINTKNLGTTSVSPSDLSPDKIQQFSEALVLAAKSCSGTTFTCCQSFIARHTKLNLHDTWFYVTVNMKVLSSYWNGDSSVPAQVEMLLRNAFGLFAVLSQDPERHQVLREGEPECALQTSRGLLPEYANMENPKAKMVADMVSFMD